MTKYAFSAPDQAPPVGPYSPAVVSAGFVYVSGQVGVDAEGNVVGSGAADQAVAAMNNLRAIVLNTGLSMADVVKTTIFLTDIADFAAVNEVYASYFEPPYPARSTVQVSALPKGVKVEVEAIAMRGS